MKLFSRSLLSRSLAALGLAVVVAASAFAQAPAPMKATKVKGYTKTLKSGKMVHVHGYTRKTSMMPKMTHVGGYTKTLKSGKTVSVKGYSRKAPMKGMKKMAPKPGSTM